MSDDKSPNDTPRVKFKESPPITVSVTGVSGSYTKEIDKSRKANFVRIHENLSPQGGEGKQLIMIHDVQILTVSLLKVEMSYLEAIQKRKMAKST